MDLYTYFGLRKGNPFLAAPRYDWRGLRFVVNRLCDTARDLEWTLIFGPPGTGKTEALRAFRERHENDVWIVEVKALSRRCLRMAALYDALYEDLDFAGLGERREGRREARARQIERVAGQREMERHILIVLDDASLFGQDLLNGIKVMRDLRWKGRKVQHRLPHFGVAMFGWESLASRVARVPQNQIRVRRREVKPMSRNELAGFLDHVGLSRIVPEPTQNALPQNARFPGVVEHLVTVGMERAAAAGRRVLVPEDVGYRDLSDIEKLVDECGRYGISQRDIANATATDGKGRVSPTTVCHVMQGKFQGREATRTKVTTAAAQLIEDRKADEGSRKPTRRLSA